MGIVPLRELSVSVHLHIVFLLVYMAAYEAVDFDRRKV